MTRIAFMTLACGLGLVAGTAHAEDSKGFYIGVDAGVASPSDADIGYYDVGGTFGGTGTTDTVDGTVALDNSLALSGVLGYDFGLIRADIEVAYSKNNISGLTVNNVNGSPVTLDPADGAEVCDYLDEDGCTVSGNTISYDGGYVRQLSAMGNLWLDIPVGGAITPYIGGGLGVNGFEDGDDGTAKFAWQLGAGVNLKLSSVISLDANYRHRESSSSTIEWDANSGFTLGKLKTDSFTAGLRLTL
jgi:opacity protein-like surface antigen